ncbi:phospholipase D-like domain-containing protein [Sphingomicrobium clamense]|uniref:Phospholipase D n=1 Tax=Sphingomicrobium clamense TaxID=2851013 RepID=A0ABS6V3I7_9SPHN|nr:phosphatidylserine/phosphatidylglycerophosphate/cardiolipin synthase family protein [Sphingomicrobium sp. B8]MBW0144123.1 phosphatidylserine/phosphatidylglycerophosphate/cardiolipin synthase family protein [Sphingomicrobium sp. B8]
MGKSETENSVSIDNPDPPITGEVDGNSLRLLPSGEERVGTMVEMIDAAEERIRLLFYLFEGDEEGTKVRDALARAAGRGVRVDMILDDFGTNGAPDDFFDPITEAGGETCVFHPHVGRRYFIRNHQKLAIFDGQRAIIGGANLSKDYLTDGREGCWRDLWLQIDGPTVEHAVNYFDALDDWTKNGKSSTTALKKIIVDFSQQEGKLRWVFGGPRPRISPMLNAIVQDIGSARSLKMVAAYFSPSRAMLRRIGDVAARGGEAAVLTAAKSDNNATIAAARHTYKRLLRRGVKMYEFDKCRLHMKLIVVDDAVYIGSSNFDFRSLYINLELMLRIEDADFAERMHEFAQSEMDGSQEITPELHAERSSWWRRLKWAISRWLVTSMDYTVSRRLNFPLTGE